MHYIIETAEDGTWKRVYVKPEPKSAARVIYSGKKPLNIGMNQAKRLARYADKRDRALVLQHLGSMPKQKTDTRHQQLVRSRHHYYHEAHDELTRQVSAP